MLNWSAFSWNILCENLYELWRSSHTTKNSSVNQPFFSQKQDHLNLLVFFHNEGSYFIFPDYSGSCLIQTQKLVELYFFPCYCLSFLKVVLTFLIAFPAVSLIPKYDSNYHLIYFCAPNLKNNTNLIYERTFTNFSWLAWFRLWHQVFLVMKFTVCFSAMLCNTFLTFSIMTQLNTVYYGQVCRAFALSMSAGASLLMLIMVLYQTLAK